jgi:hypothetical protein
MKRSSTEWKPTQWAQPTEGEDEHEHQEGEDEDEHQEGEDEHEHQEGEDEEGEPESRASLNSESIQNWVSSELHQTECKASSTKLIAKRARAGSIQKLKQRPCRAELRRSQWSKSEVKLK